MTFTLSRFIITENAYFFSIKKAISKKLMGEIITAATIVKQGAYVYKGVKEVQVYNGTNFTISSGVFKYESNPSFLTPGKEIETKYGYILLVEYQNYLVVSRRATSDFGALLDGIVEEIDYNTLSKFKITASTEYKKLGVTNLDTSKTAMRRAIYEAQDVKGALSTISTGNKVVSSLKIKNSSGQTSIAIGTSRVNDLGNKVVLKDFCLWAAKQTHQISSYKPAKTYLDNFAEPMNYAKEINLLVPVSVLFNFSPFLDDFEAGLINKVWFKNREIQLKSIFENHDLCMDIAYNAKTTGYEIQNNFDSSLILIKGKNNISIDGSKLKHINIEYNAGDFINLLGRINKDSLFTVSFQNIDIRYTTRTLFRDNKLLGNIDYFLKSIETSPFLKTAVSEKGVIKASSTSFDANSLFGIIETSLSSDQYLLCDDLGDEWADYIGFTDGTSIRFYHAKTSKQKYSASAFHDLVSRL